MSTSTILRPEILQVGNRAYRINPSSLPGLEPIDDQQFQVYREEDEADYYQQHGDPEDDEPGCKPQAKPTPAREQQEKSSPGIALSTSL